MGNKQGNGYGKGTFIEKYLILSPAFLSLGAKGTSSTVSSSSVKILLMLLSKRQFSKTNRPKGSKNYVRSDDNKFTLTYKELEARGIKQGSATRGFDELLSKGFIRVVDPGGTFEKHKAVYALEDNYLSWREGHPPIFKRQHDVHRGFQDPKRRGTPNIKTALVNEGHPHACQRGAPKEKTHSLTVHTPTSKKL